MRKLVFATGNANKVKEVNEILAGIYEIVPMKDIGCEEDIPETSPTLEGNAIQKAQYLKEHYGADCFSEDTGLEIDALNGEPGVYTARYAGLPRSHDNNMNLVLQKLQNEANRKARFRTAIALIINGEQHIFEGTVEGKIALTRIGEGGFGYDPIFIPDGYDQTFAELPSSVKHKISHRARAMSKLVAFLRKTDNDTGEA